MASTTKGNHVEEGEEAAAGGEGVITGLTEVRVEVRRKSSMRSESGFMFESGSRPVHAQRRINGFWFPSWSDISLHPSHHHLP